MDLDIVREFILLAESSNFQLAADRLSLSQSTLSKHIHKLEEELELDLFDRSKRRVMLNENGRVFLEYARGIYKLYDECIFEMRKRKHGSSNTIRVGMVKIQDRLDIIELMTEYCASHPQLQMVMVDQENIFGKADLTNGKCDFVFTADIEDFTDDEFVRIPISEDRIVAVLPPDHILAGKSSIDLADLKTERIIEHSSHYEQQMLDNMMTSQDIRLNIVASVSYSSTILKMVDQGMGIALISEGCLNDMDQYNLKKAELMYEGDFTVYLVYQKKQLPAEAREFVRVFTDGNR